MNKAFIFDMDGVIINSEVVWAQYEKDFLIEMVGQEIFEKIKDHTVGSTTSVIYDLAYEAGLKMKKQDFLQRYDKQAQIIYSLSTPTDDINKLLQKLKDLNFRIGLVSASFPNWIEIVLEKIRNKHLFEYVLSLEERKDLRPKPYPDGFLEAIKELGSTPEKTIILEDSNKGLLAAKASGAFTICIREHLPKDHISEEADMTIENLRTLMTFLDELDLQLKQ
ncbi:MAG TPA: HAD family phosphatase [Patescibacteria group bacterium]|nr:HAD family phosphatase [Patescibacteria group bacterium]